MLRWWALGLCTIVAVSACTSEPQDDPDAGPVDARAILDAAHPDATARDAGVSDAADPDAADPDAADPDAAEADASADAEGFEDALPIDTGPPPIDVLEHHNNARRDGIYVDPAFTTTAARHLRIDTTFTTSIAGPVYAQPLYFSAGPGGHDVLIIVTERNEITALDAADGHPIWSSTVAVPVPRAMLPCGNIDPLGITGTPIIDRPSRTVFFDAMSTPDGGATLRHLVFAVSIDDGSIRPGWPVDVSARIPTFDSRVSNQRGALALLHGVLYVPYGGHAGDCGNYHGTVIGIAIADPAAPIGVYAVPARAGGIWAPGGVSSDGTDLYVATGNTFGAMTWQHGEAILRLHPGPVFTATPTDYFVPTNWRYLDRIDLDVGGSAPVIFDAPGATPSQLIAAFGKNGNAYLVDRQNMGGIGPGIVTQTIARGRIINAPTAYTTPSGTFVALNPQNSVPGQCPTPGGLWGPHRRPHHADRAPGRSGRLVLEAARPRLTHGHHDQHRGDRRDRLGGWSRGRQPAPRLRCQQRRHHLRRDRGRAAWRGAALPDPHRSQGAHLRRRQQSDLGVQAVASLVCRGPLGPSFPPLSGSNWSVAEAPGCASRGGAPLRRQTTGPETPKKGGTRERYPPETATLRPQITKEAMVIPWTRQPCSWLCAMDQLLAASRASEYR